MDVPGDEGLLMWSLILWCDQIYLFQLRSGCFSWFCDFAWNKLFSFCCFKWRQVFCLRAHKSVQVWAGLQGTLRSFVSHAPETTQVWALWLQVCSWGERKKGRFLSAKREMSLCYARHQSASRPQTGRLRRLDRPEMSSLLPLCGQQVSCLTWTLILSTGWKRLPRGNWASWKHWLSWKWGRSGQTRRKGNRHPLLLFIVIIIIIVVISSPCTILFILVFIILHFITKFLFKWKSHH